MGRYLFRSFNVIEKTPLSNVESEDERVFSHGGELVGKSHDEGGIEAVIDDTEPIEVEGGEVIINKKAVKKKGVKTRRGTNKEILNDINTETGGRAIMEKGGEMKHGFKKFIKDQINYVISLKKVSEKRKVLKNLIHNLPDYNGDEMDKRITESNLKYAIGLKTASQINKALKISLNAYEKGGKLKACSYKGKTDGQIWDEWTPKQREHFLDDHLALFDRTRDPHLSYKELKEGHYLDILTALKFHVKEGQYGKGGKFKKKSLFKKKYESGGMAKRDEWKAIQKSMDTSHVHTDTSKLKKGDYALIENRPNSFYEGLVVSIGSKNIKLKAPYGGWGGEDYKEFQELTFAKDKVRKYFNPKKQKKNLIAETEKEVNKRIEKEIKSKSHKKHKKHHHWGKVSGHERRTYKKGGTAKRNKFLFKTFGV